MAFGALLTLCLALVRVLLAPGTTLLALGLALLAALGIFLAPGLEARAALLVPGLDVVAGRTSSAR
jgi:hypothetical protein